jgi:hypothetical protein
MLQRLANVVLGVTIVVVAGGMLLLHLASGQPAQALVLLLAGLLFAAGLVTSVWGGLTAEGQSGPVQHAGVEAAWRLRELKRATASRYRGLRGVSLAPWKL